MIRRALPSLAVVLVLASVAAACGGGDGVSVEGPDGAQVDIGDDGITVEGPTGTDVAIGTAEYPEGWPPDFPVPDGAAPAFSIGAEGDVAVWFATDQSADEIRSFYEAALPAAGYTVDSAVDVDSVSGSYTALSISGNGWTGGIMMGEGVKDAAIGFTGDFAFWVTLSSTAY